VTSTGNLGAARNRTRGGARRDAAALGALDLERHLGDPALKQQFVTPMFDLIARRYDQFTRVFSFGMDRAWKRELVTCALDALPEVRCAVDVACGTGDLAFAIARARPGVRVLGVDASARMIDVARERLAVGRSPSDAEGLSFQVGDVMRLDLPSASVDLVTAGYALRNVPDHRLALRELARVVRPGGSLLTLDFYRPASAWWRTLFLAYLSAAGRALGWLWHREPLAYGYIARSIAHFVSAEQFGADLCAAGFRLEAVRPKLFGGIALHVAHRM
jgi:demethylmenaquinone methyltransferase/2-methoxy-6-polyprenyl-1,4-benzoquinol methylase